MPRKKYVPHLAEFYFEPTHSWSSVEALEMYNTTKRGVDAIYYEDCIEGVKKLPDGIASLVVSDPPFGISFDDDQPYNRDGSLIVDGYVEVPSEQYEEFSRQWIAELPRILTPEGSAYIFSGWTHLRHVLNAVHAAGLTVQNEIIWKYQFGTYTKKKFTSSHYHIIFATRGKKYFFNNISNYNEDVWEVNRDYATGQRKNRTKLPAELVKRCIDFSSKPGDVVVDFFMGNGTTAAVAKANYRHYLGFEINEKMRSGIEKTIKSTTTGGDYVPYRRGKEEMLEIARKYPRAYREFLRRQGKQGKLF